MEFYSGTKKNKILSFAGKWMELVSIMLVKLARFRKSKAVFCQMWNKVPNINAAIF
jgi:hypothetical protein